MQVLQSRQQTSQATRTHRRGPPVPRLHASSLYVASSRSSSINSSTVTSTTTSPLPASPHEESSMPYESIAQEVEKSIPKDLPEAEKETYRQERISQAVSAEEQLRRQRIGAANKGRVTWNKGRKHRPETIAKIKARTAEAMKSQEVINAYKASMEPLLQEKKIKSEERKAKLKEEKEKAAAAAAVERAAAAAARAAQAEARKAATAEAAAAGLPNPYPPKPRAKPKAKPPPAEGEAAAPKKRAPYSDEHRRRISEAIRAKWQDAEYRARAVNAIQEERESRAGPFTRSSRSRSSSGRQRTGSTSANGIRKPTREQVIKEKLGQLQILIKHIISSQDLVARTDMQLEATRLKVQAFENDPHMAAKAQGVVANVESMLASMRAKLSGLLAQLPAGTHFDRHGSISFTSQEAAASLMDWSLPAGGSSSTSPSTSSSPASPSSPSFNSGGSSPSTKNSSGAASPNGFASPHPHPPSPTHPAAGRVGSAPSPQQPSQPEVDPNRVPGGGEGRVPGVDRAGTHHLWEGVWPANLPPGHPTLNEELAARAAAASPARRSELEGYMVQKETRTRAGGSSKAAEVVYGEGGESMAASKGNVEGWPLQQQQQQGVQGEGSSSSDRSSSSSYMSSNGSSKSSTSSPHASFTNKVPSRVSRGNSGGKGAGRESSEAADFTPSTRTRRVRK